MTLSRQSSSMASRSRASPCAHTTSEGQATIQCARESARNKTPASPLEGLSSTMCAYEPAAYQDRFGEENEMKRVLSTAAAVVAIVAAVAWATSLADGARGRIEDRSLIV